MADTKDLDARHSEAMASIAKSLGVEVVDLQAEVRNDPHMARVLTMENIAAGWTMTQIHLDVVATVPKVAQCDFIDAALRAKANCPISRSLNANISMCAKLFRKNI